MQELSKETQGTAVKKGEVFAFITVMRVVATIMITNTHFGKIWPISQLAVGGLIGDLLFFAVSGFCLLHSAENGFLKFAKKRILRIYPSIILITLVFFLAGKLEISGLLGREGVLGRFIYPTNFHFIESIVLLYVCLYPCIRFDFLKKRLPLVMGVVAVGFLVAYILTDKTVKLDTAAHFLTKFLFFEVMLYGAYTRQHMDKCKRPVLNWVLFLLSTGAYFVAKMLISEKSFNNLQILIFISIFCVGATSIRAFGSVENVFAKLPQRVVKAIKFVADMTLEIYVVQTTLISIVVSWKLPFVVRFPLIVLMIFAAAFVCNRTAKYITKLFEQLISKCFNKK